MSDLLKKYRAMRDFGATPEPSGGKPKGTMLPIFVIQKHQASRLHYDFRLEMEGVLKSWAVPKGPSYDPTVKRLAMMTEDHPYDYADFEGVIPVGNYGGGNVIIWDNGTYELTEPDDGVKGIKQGKLAFKMYGKKMFGEWALVKIKGRSPKGNEWLLLKHRDGYANADVDVTELAPQSIISGKKVEEIGDSTNFWQSNRPASGGRAPTLASRLAAEEAQRNAAVSAAGPAASRRRVVAGETPAVQPAGRRRSGSTKTKRASAPTRSARAPRKAASSRSRSSPAGSPPKARPTRRRRPR
jgi:bifunctional non-homologous end joining protein LigD